MRQENVRKFVSSYIILFLMLFIALGLPRDYGYVSWKKFVAIPAQIKLFLCFVPFIASLAVTFVKDKPNDR